MTFTDFGVLFIVIIELHGVWNLIRQKWSYYAQQAMVGRSVIQAAQQLQRGTDQDTLVISAGDLSLSIALTGQPGIPVATKAQKIGFNQE